uniref:Putative acyl-coa synthetase n=1 Tax=Ornithodoros turicata TaxID=34597 RepID=A0A2R5LCR0_9ACAR
MEEGVVYSPYPDIDYPDNLSFYHYTKRWMLRHSDGIAIIDGERRVTFDAALKGIQRYADGYRSQGLKTGDRVCVHLSNSAEAMMACYGVIAAGGAVVLAKPTLTRGELLYILRTSRASFIVLDAIHAEKVRSISDEVSLKGKFSLGPADGFFPVANFQSVETSLFKPCAISETKSATAVLTYTSGTTGLPKATDISHYALISAMEVMRCLKLFEDKDVLLAWNPITHISGFVFYISSLCYGTLSVVGSNRMPVEGFISTVNAHKVTSMCAFPTAFQKLLVQLESLQVKLPSLKKVFIAGAVATEALIRKALKVFELDSFQNGYGMSEAGGFLAMTPPGQLTREATVGFVAPSCKCKVIDVVTGRAVPAGTDGEILFQGPPLFTRYDGEPQATSSAFDKDSFFRTGDLGSYDSEGRFYVKDRIKDMIKCLDNQIAPAEVENLLLSHAEVAEAVVVGVPHEDYGEAPTAMVVLKEPRHSSPDQVAEELKELVQSQLTEYKHLHGGVIFIEAIPKTDSGKCLRRELRQRALKVSGLCVADGGPY